MSQHAKHVSRKSGRAHFSREQGVDAPHVQRGMFEDRMCHACAPPPRPYSYTSRPPIKTLHSEHRVLYVRAHADRPPSRPTRSVAAGKRAHFGFHGEKVDTREKTAAFTHLGPSSRPNYPFLYTVKGDVARLCPFHLFENFF